MVQLTQDMIDGAQKTEQEYGVPASVTLAQIMQESSSKNPEKNGGLSDLAYYYHNLFGMTEAGTNGTVSMKSGAGDNYATITYGSYKTDEDSIEAHGKRVAGYSSEKNAKTPTDWINGLVKAGYATDPNYGTALKSLISRYDLTKYDNGQYGGVSNVPKTSTTVSAKDSTTAQVNTNWIGTILMFIIMVGCIVVGIIAFMRALDIQSPKFNKGVSQGMDAEPAVSSSTPKAAEAITAALTE